LLYHGEANGTHKGATLRRRRFVVAFIVVTVAAFVAGYAYAGLDDPAAVYISVTMTAAPQPTATEAMPTPTAEPTEASIIISLPDCTEPDTPSGSLCVFGNIAYPECDRDAPTSREPCYKP
jgi:hypothetical protein